MKLQEAISPNVLKKREAEIIILEEGPGNKARKCWYGIEAIESGQHVFRGAQVFGNHPSKTQQVDLPERDVKELIGRIKETYVVTDPITKKKQLRGILKVFEGNSYDWALSQIHESIQARKEGFPPVVQVSIHADGDIEKRIMEGDEYNYVTNIKSAVSVDMVTKGGVLNAGFTKFVESIHGGKTMTRNEERLSQIHQKMLGALNGEDQQFLEAFAKEEEEQALREDQGAEEGAEDEYEEVFEDENGNLVNAAGEQVDPAEVFAVDADGNTASLAELAAAEQDEAQNEVQEVEEDEEIEEPMTQAEMQAMAEEEVPIAELAMRYPHLAQQIDREEAHQMESRRDADIVNLKMENGLLKSRMVAEHKIRESKLPEGYILIDDLLGKPVEDMDRIIESRKAMLRSTLQIVDCAYRDW